MTVSHTNRQPFTFAASPSELFQARGHFKRVDFASGRAPEVKVFPTSGFHLYVRLGLNLDLEAADRDPSIRKFLRLIQDYARLAASLTDGSEASLLELQGETLHLFLPADLSAHSLRNVLAYAVAFRDELCATVKNQAGSDWKGLRFALDHGQTLLVDSTRNVDDSIISLAPAANRPAKQFRKSSDIFPSDSIRFLAGLVLEIPEFRRLATAQNVYAANRWLSVPIETVKTVLESADQGLRKIAALEQRMRQRMAENSGATNFTNVQIHESLSTGTIKAPSRLTGWVLRADLHGFSAKVAEAFEAKDREAALTRLTSDFLETMEDATLFDQDCPWELLDLPWAGDCASRIILSTRYDSDALQLPGKMASRWHNRAEKGGWLVAMAGGDTDEGKGLVLVADIEVDGRIHRVTGGWAVRRSKQGEQEIGGKPHETVLHRRDSSRLEEPWKGAFCEIDGVFNFRKATKLGLERAANKVIDKRSNVARSACAPQIVLPRPYAH